MLLMTALLPVNLLICWGWYGSLPGMHGLSGGMMLNSDYRDILSLFIEEKVEFMLIGAYALAAHGVPRATGDIDLFIKPDRFNSEKVYKALVRFGAPLSDVSPDDFQDENIILQIGVVPRRIDILTSIDGLTFEEASENVLLSDVEGLIIPVISAECFIKNKEAAGRDKDLLDVKILKKHLKL